MTNRPKGFAGRHNIDAGALFRNNYAAIFGVNGSNRMGKHKRKKIAYVAGPYSGKTASEIHWNIQRARTIAEALWKHGYAVICPHMNSDFMDGVVPYSDFMDGYLEILRYADLVVVTDNYQDSPGALEEIALAEQWDIPVLSRSEALGSD